MKCVPECKVTEPHESRVIVHDVQLFNPSCMKDNELV